MSLHLVTVEHVEPGQFRDPLVRLVQSMSNTIKLLFLPNCPVVVFDNLATLLLLLLQLNLFLFLCLLLFELCFPLLLLLRLQLRLLPLFLFLVHFGLFLLRHLRRSLLGSASIHRRLIFIVIRLLRWVQAGNIVHQLNLNFLYR